MRKSFVFAGRAALYAVFASFIGVFASFPVYRHLAADEALLKLSFSHAAQLAHECRRRSPEELEKLAPNMRVPLDCSRERSPVTVELRLDGRMLAQRLARPAGLAHDGASTLYERFVVPAGEHELSVVLNDNARVTGATYQRDARVSLNPGQVLVVDFNPERGGILLQ